jgi:drug/metabolite transporter (DMT)-like permease
VIIFSGSLPATRLAVQDMDPLLLTFLRASIAGLLAVAAGRLSPETPAPGAACALDHRLIRGGDRLSLLTALALQRITSAHSIVFIGLLPLMTALFGVLRGGERPRRAFWIFSLLGSLLVVGFALTQSAAPRSAAIC